MERLRGLLQAAGESRKRWAVGRRPKHYKRINIDEKEQDRLAVLGQIKIMTAYMQPLTLYYTQAIIAGAMLSGDYDTIIAVTPSQYGKSWLLGHIAPVMAYNGQRLSVAGATASVTEIIMTHARQALRDAEPLIKEGLSTEGIKKVDRLDTSLSKTRLAWKDGGYIEALTLGDTFSGKGHNKAVGRGSAYIVDEAALVSDDALVEIGRRELSGTDGRKELLVMISNPHNPGAFYEALTDQNPDERTLIVWMDALTAAQEGRWTPEQILDSEFAKHALTRTCYWMCELPESGLGMFGDPIISKEQPEGLHFLGVDAAYKGVDKIELAHAVMTEDNRIAVVEAVTIDKSNWIDGATGADIVGTIKKIYKGTGAQLVCVDLGQGIWLTEGLTGAGVHTKGVYFGGGATKERVKKKHYAATNAANKRAEMHLDLQSLIETEQLTIAPGVWEQLSECWPFVTAKRKSSGKIEICPKEEIKAKIGHSPDALDAVLLAIHAAILYKAEAREYITERREAKAWDTLKH